MVKNVIGMSTIVRARASMKGWYIAARWWRLMMGRWAYKAGISAMADIAPKRIAKYITPPLEKKDAVVSGVCKYVVPITTA